MKSVSRVSVREIAREAFVVIIRGMLDEKRYAVSVYRFFVPTV